MSKVVDVERLEDFKALLSDNDKVVVKFWATWCQPCKSFAPKFEEAAERSSATFVAVDVDKARDLMVEYDVRAVPTVLMFSNGEVRRVFARTTYALLEELEEG